jgi:hypothetical protein
MANEDRKTLLILDGQGGGVGRRIAEKVTAADLPLDVIAVGSNAAATSNMMRVGGVAGATGENAWVYNCARADYIVGPIGIILPNAMRGEISPRMALAVTESRAKKLVLPVANHQNHLRIIGMPESSPTAYLDEMVSALQAECR